MNSCAYCHKELDRLMFCNHSHQVLYHRKGEKRSSKTIKELTTPDPIVEFNTIDKNNWQPPANLSKEFFTAKGKKRK